NMDPSHFWWQGADPIRVIGELGPVVGWCHGKDTTLYPDRIALHGVMDHRYPVDASWAPWDFSGIGDGHDGASLSRLIKALHGATTIYVTHDQAEAMTMADRVCLISDGVVQQYAPAQEIFDRPANRFVASFVGNPPMNILTIALDSEGRSMILAGAGVPLGDRYDACADAGVEQIGVRARDLSITPPAEPGSIPATVYVVEPMGDEVYVEV